MYKKLFFELGNITLDCYNSRHKNGSDLNRFSQASVKKYTDIINMNTEVL